MQAVKDRAKTDFTFFVEHIFAASFPKFISGEHVRNVCAFLQNNKKTIRVSARDHFKSTGTYAHVMWRILQTEGLPDENGEYQPYDWDAYYFSYQKELAAHHIGGHKDSIRRLIERNPYYKGIHDLKSRAESILMYSWDAEKGDAKHIAMVKPQGLLAFKRGLHAPTVYVDDPFQDPEDKMNPTTILKINRTFLNQVMSIPHKDGELHVVGTAQTKDDFYFDKDITHRFAVSILSAVVDWDRKIALWPEWMDWDELMSKRRELGRWFPQEYLCEPVSSESAFFQREQIDRITYPIYSVSGRLMSDRKKWLLTTPFEQKAPFTYPIVAGLDIGKKRHPSHVAVFEIRGQKWDMIYQEFWDFMDYYDQVLKCGEIIHHFGVEFFGFDNTRGEFEGFMEQGILPSEMSPVILNNRKKGALSAKFDEKVTRNHMRLLEDERLKKSILSVTNEVVALETPEGHGDAFFSIMCALDWEVQHGEASEMSDNAKKKDATMVGNIMSENF